MLFTLTWVNYTSPAIKSSVRVWGACQSTCKNANLRVYSSMVLDLACVKYNTSNQNLMCARLSFQEHQTVKMSFPYSGVYYFLILCQIWGSLSGVAKDSSLLWCKPFHLVCTVLGVLAASDEGTMLFKKVINFTYSGTSQRIWIYSHFYFCECSNAM